MRKRSDFFGNLVEFTALTDWPLLVANGPEEGQAILQHASNRNLVARGQTGTQWALTWDGWQAVEQEFDMFNQFMTDTLTMYKPDGQVFENIRACVTGNGILIEDVRLPIEAGDKLTRSLPSGLTEEFIVDDPGFHERFSGIAAHFQVRVRRANSETSPPRVQNVFYGPVGSLAQNSQHFSQIASIGIQSQDLTRLINELATHLDELNLDPRQKQRAEAQLVILKVELAGEADPAIVKQAGRTLRNIIEGAIGSLLATAAQPGLWHWIHNTLASF